MNAKVTPDTPENNGWDRALTADADQFVFDSYKTQRKGIILMSVIDWVVAVCLEIDPKISSYRYCRDPYRPYRKSNPKWRFVVKPTCGPTFLLEAFDRNRKKSDRKTRSRRHVVWYINDLPRPEVILSNADACAYLVAAWDHQLSSVEKNIHSTLQDKIVRTLRELFEIVGGNHPLFVTALLRLYTSRAIDTNLDSAPLGWITHIAAFGVLKHGES